MNAAYLEIDNQFIEEGIIMGRKTTCLLLSAACLLTVLALPLLSSQDEKVRVEEKKPVIGIAWQKYLGETYYATCQAIEAAGGMPVLLGQVFSADLSYDDNGMLKDAKDADGALTPEAAKPVRCNTWQSSNADTVMEGISAVVFTGGSNVSPSLYYTPEPVKSVESYNAERDVSDYILMSYCLEHDIPVLGLCRGMQILSIVSGAEMIQDIPDYMVSIGKSYAYEHRNEPEEPGAYRDFALHDVTVTDGNSILYRLTGMKTIHAVPSWHHQAVKSVEGTRLKVSGFTETNGLELIEAVERTDKGFALGLQYHPEIAVVREMDEVSLSYFEALVNLAG